VCDKYKEKRKLKIFHDNLSAGSSMLKQKQFIKETEVHCDEMMTKLRWMWSCDCIHLSLWICSMYRNVF